MVDKKHASQNPDKDDSDEIIERLVPDSENSAKGKGKGKGKQDNKRKKKQRYKKRTVEPSQAALAAEIPKQKTVEEIWEESTDETVLVKSGKTALILPILIVIAVLAGVWGLWQSTNITSENEKNSTSLVREAKEIEKLALSEEISLASNIVERYLAAKTVAQKSKYIYQSESLKDELKNYYHDHEGLRPVNNYTIRGIFPIRLNGEQIIEVVTKSKNSNIDQYRDYYIRKTPDGDYKIDWKADVIFQDNDIEDFIKTRSREPTSFRFEIKRVSKMKIYDWALKKIDYSVHHVNIPFSDEVFWGLKSRFEIGPYNWGFKDTEYNVLRLDIPNSDVLLWGYVEKGSEVERTLYKYIESNMKQRILERTVKHEFILKVRFLDDSPVENDQYVLIDEVISPKWVNMNE